MRKWFIAGYMLLLVGVICFVTHEANGYKKALKDRYRPNCTTDMECQQLYGFDMYGN